MRSAAQLGGVAQTLDHADSVPDPEEENARQALGEMFRVTELHVVTKLAEANAASDRLTAAMGELEVTEQVALFSIINVS